MTRIIITPADIMLLTEKSESYARKVIQMIKHYLNKERHHMITIKEYCEYFGLNFSEVMDRLSQNKKSSQTPVY